MTTRARHENVVDEFSPPPKKEKNLLSQESLLYRTFVSYQQELDARNEKYERIVKLSRDVTIHSKKLIFSLLRKGEDHKTILLEDAKGKVHTVLDMIEKIGFEVSNEDMHKFHRAFSPGLQEFIESVTLMHYIKDGILISFEDVKNLYFTKYDILAQFDYMLGVADLTGELMRMTINSIGDGEFNQAEKTCSILRSIYLKFSMYYGCHRDINQKINVMKNSLQKVENACYTLKVQGSELPTHMLKELANASVELYD